MRSDVFRTWRANVGSHLGWIYTGEYRYYYCSLWCFLTDQRLCKRAAKRQEEA